MARKPKTQEPPNQATTPAISEAPNPEAPAPEAKAPKAHPEAIGPRRIIQPNGTIREDF